MRRGERVVLKGKNENGGGEGRRKIKWGGNGRGRKEGLMVHVVRFRVSESDLEFRNRQVTVKNVCDVALKRNVLSARRSIHEWAKNSHKSIRRGWPCQQGQGTETA